MHIIDKKAYHYYRILYGGGQKGFFEAVSATASEPSVNGGLYGGGRVKTTASVNTYWQRAYVLAGTLLPSGYVSASICNRSLKLVSNYILTPFTGQHTIALARASLSLERALRTIPVRPKRRILDTARVTPESDSLHFANGRNMNE